MHSLSSRHEFDAVLREPAAVVFKHSTRCPISAAAYKQLAAVDGREPAAPVYLVDVHERRDPSDYIAERLGMPHDSPQAFVLARGARDRSGAARGRGGVRAGGLLQLSAMSSRLSAGAVRGARLGTGHVPLMPRGS